MSDMVSLVLGRIENEISRHKAAHESHLHWAIILFAANIALFIRTGLSADLWSLPAIGIVLNFALWCRAARAYNALARHWESRDKMYEALLRNPSDIAAQKMIGNIVPFLDGDQSRRVWIKGALSTLIRVGLPEFLVLEAVYVFIAIHVLYHAPENTTLMLALVIPSIICILVFGLMRLQVRISVLHDGDYLHSDSKGSKVPESLSEMSEVK